MAFANVFLCLLTDYNIYYNGEENSLVEEDYNCSINLLENTEPTSIYQLKNILLSFWHLDRQIKDYNDFISKECDCNLGIKIGKDLALRSSETFAKIGFFYHNEKKYNVTAQHILADERKNVSNKRKFFSMTNGATTIAISESGRAGQVSHMFSVCLGRKSKDSEDIYNETHSLHKIEPVLNNERHLVVDNLLCYNDSTKAPEGSDRLLDQKLTQIMIEMIIQNERIVSLDVISAFDDLPVLVAAGFEAEINKGILNELIRFRSIEGNKIFPPYFDYGSDPTIFKKEWLAEERVYFSKDVNIIASWDEIINKEPILTEKSGILPEYWEVKPNIVDEN